MAYLGQPIQPIWQQLLKWWKLNFLHIFAVPLSSRHEKCCQILEPEDKNNIKLDHKRSQWITTDQNEPILKIIKNYSCIYLNSTLSILISTHKLNLSQVKQNLSNCINRLTMDQNGSNESKWFKINQDYS